MADFEHRDNSGSLFVNERKTLDKHPDRTGDGKIKCPHCEEEFKIRMSGWVKDGKGGKANWLSMAFTPDGGEPTGPRTAAPRDVGEHAIRVPPPAQAPRPTGQTRGFEGIDDDIPF